MTNQTYRSGFLHPIKACAKPPWQERTKPSMPVPVQRICDSKPLIYLNVPGKSIRCNPINIVWNEIAIVFQPLCLWFSCKQGASLWWKSTGFCPSQPMTLSMLLTSLSLNFLISKMGMIIICQVRLISALGFPESCSKDKRQLKCVKATWEPGRQKAFILRSYS